MKKPGRIRKKFLLRVIIVLAATVVFWLACKNLAVRLMLPIAKNQIEKYTGQEVEIESIDVGFNGLATMKGVKISSCLDASGETPLLTAKTIMAEFPVSSMFLLRPRLRSLTVEDFVLDFRYDQDLSSWNLLLTGGSGGKKKKKSLSALLLRNGTVEFSRIKGGASEKIISVGVTKGAIADIENKNGLGFQFDINPSVSGLSGVIGGKLETGRNGKDGNLVITSEKFSTGPVAILGNTWNIGKLRLDIDYNKDDISVNKFEWQMGEDCRFSLSGKVTDYLKDGSYSGQLEVKNMHVSETATEDAMVYNEGVSEYTGKGLRKFLGIYKPDGVCDIKYKATGKLSDFRKSKWSGIVTCKDISIQHDKFRYQLEHVTGQIKVSNKGSDFSGLKCKHGDVEFDIRGGTKIIDGMKVTDVTVTSGNMLLGNDVYRALNKKQQSIWWTFTPEGRAKISYNYKRRHDQIKGRTELEIDMLGGEADYLHFPYHLENITGRIRITPEQVEIIDLLSSSQDSSITLNGKVTDIRSSRPRYNVVIRAKNIPLDSRLKAALPYSQRSFYDNFEMTARTDAEIKVFPNHVGKRQVEYIARVSIKDATMVYKDFPLPLTNVNVKATLTPSDTTITEMSGKNGDGTVKINGKVWPSNEEYSKPGYCLELDAENIKVDGGWLKALPADSYKVLSSLRPEGSVNVSANLSVDPRTECPGFKIVVESLGGSVNYTKFPYPIENIFGKAIIEKDKVTLENVRSIIAPLNYGNEIVQGSITVNGEIVSENHKVKNCRFAVSAEDVNFDNKLVKAFGGYSGIFNKGLNPSGRFDLSIDELVYKKDGDNTGVADLSSELTLKEVTLNNKGFLDGISGKLKSEITYKSGVGLTSAKGQYNAVSVAIKGRSIKDIRGGVFFDPNSNSVISREYTGNCYGGKILGSLSLEQKKDKRMGYSIETIFTEVDLRDLFNSKSKTGKNEDYTKGKVSGYFGASGVFGDDKSRIGRLNLKASGMEFARRTILGKIITASQLEDPTDFIFSDIKTEAYLHNNKLHLDDVMISGKSMQMKGAGSLDIADGAISMKFNAYGKKSLSEPSFIDTLTMSLGSAVASVKVDGTLDNPKIERTVLPVISKPFEILGSKE